MCPADATHPAVIWARSNCACCRLCLAAPRMPRCKCAATFSCRWQKDVEARFHVCSRALPAWSHGWSRSIASTQWRGALRSNRRNSPKFGSERDWQPIPVLSKSEEVDKFPYTGGSDHLRLSFSRRNRPRCAPRCDIVFPHPARPDLDCVAPHYTLAEAPSVPAAIFQRQHCMHFYHRFGVNYLPAWPSAEPAARAKTFTATLASR